MFIYLIKSCIIGSNRFFSDNLMNNTPFLVVNRAEISMVDMMSCTVALMNLFGYRNRYINYEKCNLSDEKIKKKGKKPSKDFLRSL